MLKQEIRLEIIIYFVLSIVPNPRSFMRLLWNAFNFRGTYLSQGPCPNCGTENVSFFGTILSIPNDSNTNNVKCSG